MPPIVLTTINARYSHTAFGLRWLWANLGGLREQASILEWTFDHSPLEIAEALLAENPRIIGFGVYIWNVTPTTQVVQAIKGVRPDVVIVLGGPEVSHEYDDTAVFAAADYLIRGEGELAFANLARTLLDGARPAGKVIAAPPPALDTLALPYDAYTEEDIQRRLLYVEASRGCPFRCAFCLSSLEPRVREFPLEGFLDAMARLIERGGKRFKFVDRTFNVRQERAEAILRFLQSHWREDMQVHLEIVPDRLSEPLLELIAEFPPGGLRLEVGVQSFNPDVQTAIGRDQDLRKTEENLTFLRARTGSIIHADLIAGLPGETWESFASGFDRLVALGPQEIQVGILKRLKGTPIVLHAPARAMVFANHPPYELLQNDRLDFAQMQRIKRFARYFDLYYNSGNFLRTLPLLWRTRPSAFDAFMAFSDSLWAATRRTHEFPLERLARHLFEFLAQAGTDDAATIAEAVRQDYHRVPGRKDKLRFLC